MNILRNILQKMKIKFKIRDNWMHITPSNVQEGEMVYCHTDLIMKSSTNVIGACKGKYYKIDSVQQTNITIHTEIGTFHTFSFDTYSNPNNWFRKRKMKNEEKEEIIS